MVIFFYGRERTGIFLWFFFFLAGGKGGIFFWFFLAEGYIPSSFFSFLTGDGVDR